MNRTARLKVLLKEQSALTCHKVKTPGIVVDSWKASKHSGAVVTCDKCHGKDHLNLYMPTPDSCGTKECHRQTG